VAQGRDGLIGIAVDLKRDPQRVMGPREVGFRGDCSPQQGDGFRNTSGSQVVVAKVVQRRVIIGIEPKRHLPGRFGVLSASRGPTTHGQRLERFG
jgi:hypothetical protein